MSVNVNSITDSYNAWYDYNYGGNTRGITSDELTEIETRWSTNLGKWKVQAETDENKYEISDDDYSAKKDAGKDNAKEATGFGGGKTGAITRGIVDGAVVVGVNVVANAASKAIATKITTKITENVTKKATKQALEEGIEEVAANRIGQQTGQEIGQSTSKKMGSWIVAAPASLLVGTAYQAKKPNKNEHNASNQLRDELLPEAQGNVAEAQGNMDEATENIMELGDEANDINEDANEEIKESKSYFDAYRNGALELIEKVQNGESLTDSEKEFLQEVLGEMQGQSTNITEVAAANADEVNDIYDEMGEYQEVYDTSAETIAEVEGLTDYAANFDSATETMCYVEMGAQGLNAASGGKAAIDAGKFASSGGWTTAWAWAFAAAGAGGAAMSGLGAAEQYQWARDVGAEIDLREATQELNTATLDSYSEQIDVFDDSLSIVEELETDMPDDLEIPEDGINTALTGGSDSTATGVGTTTGTETGTGTTTTTTTATNNTGTTTAATGTDSNDKPDDEIV